MIDASTQATSSETLSEATGLGGNIAIDAEAVEISELSSISSFSFSLGSGGDVGITADSLTLSSGGRIRSDALLSGDGGAIAINANEIAISGSAVELSGDPIASSIQAGSTGAIATGNGGSVDIESDRLTLTDSGKISVASEGEGAAGNISIATDILRLENGGTMNASTRSPNAAQGNIALDVGNILLIQEGAIATESPERAGSGNIELSLGTTALAFGVENIEPNGGVLTIAGQTVGLDFDNLEIDPIDEEEIIAQGMGCFNLGLRGRVGSFEIIKSGEYNVAIMRYPPLDSDSDYESTPPAREETLPDFELAPHQESRTRPSTSNPSDTTTNR